MTTLLLEIGAEEIPAGYIGPALEALSSNLTARLDDLRISHGTAKTYGTPRRLSVMLADVAQEQTTVSVDIQGPPEKVGFDENGKPTVAGEKFAEKAGVDISAVTVKETPKGSYLFAVKQEKGKPTARILADILPEIILATPFPKTMKWADLDIYFARPIRSVLALLGTEVVEFALGNLKSGRLVQGHSFMAPASVEIASPEEYEAALEKVFVFPDIEKRREMTRQSVDEAAAKLGGKVVPDEELLDINTNLVELPIASAGKFDTKFLELPKEILITAMREHQKYFAVQGDDGSLMPAFIAVNNTQAKDMNLVTTGHERVLRARLEDARFFYHGDLKATFGEWVEKLKNVLFQARLGSMYDKCQRVSAVGGYLAQAAGLEHLKANVQRAAEICKADLVSQAVIEFTNLQGVMGRVYALEKNEPEDVALAVEEHYRPTRSGGQLPTTDSGSLVAIADKLDTICGCFSIGLLPSGASDPYALRRQGIGVIQIMLDRGFSFSLLDVLKNASARFFAGDEAKAEKTALDVLEFLNTRMKGLLVDEGLSKDVVAAVTDASVDNVPYVWKRARALENLKSAPDFEPLAVSFKRVVNIIRKAEFTREAQVDAALFEHESEKALLEAVDKVSGDLASLLESGGFDEAFVAVASLRDKVDAFFDGVLVMADDEKIKNNRLSLLKKIADLFAGLADFSKLAT